MKRAARNTRNGHARFDIVCATERIDELSVVILGDGIDGEVAALQVVFQCHRLIGVDHEAVIAASGFAFSAGECVFLAALRMQEDGKIAADLLEACGEHRGDRFADHNVIVIAGR